MRADLGSRPRAQPSRGLSPRRTMSEPVCGGFDQEVLQRLRTVLAASPAVRVERVAALRQAIEHHRYVVSDLQIARALIADLARPP